MKKIFAFLLAAAMLLSLAGCGGSENNDSPEPETKETTTEASETKETTTDSPESETETEEATDETSSEPQDDGALAEEAKAKLIGEWNMSGVDEILLVFNEDGTGEYKFLTEKDITFTYLVDVKPDAMEGDFSMKLSYDTGDEEDVIFFFNRETGHLVFHNSENGGYSGVIDYDEWTRK